ncbi:para-nitrobenzyl esterase [Plenodomus tracheiphilus IPT5]|uniref:Para-nitrobenzyl esterase n=1 Tax=Plenodomus tracheiphilus IPT5 TaxID=1408161 RepID=A0A6A7B5K9_9PLEO|nr:para-nitrobenzyl esterase [Plenodomus tracheiphilus IPT5]
MSSLRDDVHQHASLQCSIRGVRSPSTIQFRGLRYAHVPARYKDSVYTDVLTLGADGIVDATTFGPSCPHLRGAQAWDLSLLGNISLPFVDGQGKAEKMDEHECLNLNVTVPADKLGNFSTQLKKLPVFVWVHGGGLSMGSNNWPQYDVAKFVERSIKIGKPVIGVAITYRHGIFGFLASEEIGAIGNMGFKDQALAFRWIKKHIAGFGGDPNNVTAVGESAGAISLSTLLCANVGTAALFERVVLMSGETTLRKPRNQRWQQQMYEEQSTHLKLDPLDSVARRRVLLDTEAEELAQRLPLAQHFTGTIEGEWLKTDVTIDTLSDIRHTEHKPSWCKEFVVGDSAHDGIVLKARVLDHPQVLTRLKEACDTYLSPTETSALLAAYKLDGEMTAKEQADRLRELVSELRFYLPALAAYRGWKDTVPSGHASRYHFHIANPFEGPFKGLASHELDVAYLLQNFNDQFDDKNRRLAENVADHFIKFANGEGWVNEDKVVVFGRDGVSKINEEDYDRVYRSGRGAILERIGRQNLWYLAEMWQGVRRESHECEGETPDARL